MLVARAPDRRWEAVVAPPVHPGLRPVVGRLVGYREDRGRPLTRDELPTPLVHLVLSAGPTIDVAGLGRFGSFVVGMDDGPSATRHDGVQDGVQLSLSPVLARAVLGVPAAALLRGVVEVDDVLGAWGRELAARLGDTGGWPARFALVERALERRLAVAAPPSPLVAGCWDALVRSRGTARIGEVAQELGWSRRHLTAGFTAEVGLSPKQTARLLRFDHARALLTRTSLSLADVAARAGFTDQAHLTNEVRAATGRTPGALRAELLPFFQDSPHATA